MKRSIPSVRNGFRSQIKNQMFTIKHLKAIFFSTIMICANCIVITLILAFPPSVSACSPGYHLTCPGSVYICWCKCDSGAIFCEDSEDDSDDGPSIPDNWVIQGRKSSYKDTVPFDIIRDLKIRVEKNKMSEPDLGSVIADNIGAPDETSGDMWGLFRIDRVRPLPTGNLETITSHNYTFSVEGSPDVFVFATRCKDRTDCHTENDNRYENPFKYRLSWEGQFLDIWWHFVGRPTNLQAKCDAAGAHATLSWNPASSQITSHWLGVDRVDGIDLSIDETATGPEGVYRMVSNANSFQMNTTPLAHYGWWVQTERTGAYNSGVFSCGLPPKGWLSISAPNCQDLSHHYQIGEPISIYNYAQASEPTNSIYGLGRAEVYIVKQNGSGYLISTSKPAWCPGEWIGNSYCRISRQEYSGQKESMHATSSWTPTEKGTFFVMTNVASSNPASFGCSSNPLCEYSPATSLTKYSGTTCQNLRFDQCRFYSPASDHIGDTESSILNGNALRVVVAEAGSCNLPLAICGKFTGPNGENLPINAIPNPMALRLSINNGTEQGISVNENNQFHYYKAEVDPPFFVGEVPEDNTTRAGNEFKVKPLANWPGMNAYVPSGYYAPAKTTTGNSEYSNQILGGLESCAKNCPIDASDTPNGPTCDFAFGSCTTEISPITVTTSDIQFLHDGSTFSPITIGWRQVTSAGVGTSFDISFSAQGETSVSWNNLSISGTPSNANTVFSYSLTDNSQLTALHTLFATKKQVMMTVTGRRLANISCGEQLAVTNSSPTRISGTDVVTVRVRQTDNLSRCDRSSPVSTDDVTGEIDATSDTNITSYEPQSHPTSNNGNLKVTVPSGATINGSYTFNSDLFVCTYTSQCPGTTQPEVSGSYKICKRSTKADNLLNVDVYITRQIIPSWWEAEGGLVYGTSIKANLPLTSTQPSTPLLCNSDPRCLPYIARSHNHISDLLGGIPITRHFSSSTENGWRSEHKQIQGTLENPSAEGNTIGMSATNASYAHLKALVESKTTIDSLAILPTTTAQLPDPGFYYLQGNQNLSPTETLTIGNNKYVFFIDGNLNIHRALTGNSNQTLNSIGPLGFLAFIVSGDIIIDPNVGTEVDYLTVDAQDGIGVSNKPPANLTGIFIADGKITIQSNGNPGENKKPDKRFIAEGSFISNSTNGIEMQRSYARSGAEYVNTNLLSGYTPTEVFRHRPGLVLNTPTELKESVVQYGEIR